MAVLNKRAIVTAIEMYGVTAIRLGRTLNPSLDALIKALFITGEQGFFYDPNDLSTMYQDATGTIPVTAAGQPVGLMLDKSKGLSLLPHSLQPALNLAGTGVAEIRPDNTFYIMRGSTGNSGAITIPTSPNKWYKLVIEILSGNPISIRTGFSASVLLLQPSHGKLPLYVNMTSFDYLRFVNLTDNQEAVFKIHSLDELKGNHAYQTTSASRPILRKNAVTGANYLQFDGSDDFLQTSDIDFTATDKVSLFAGVNVPLGATTGCVVEIGASAQSINGSFGLFKGPSTIQWASRGTTGVLGAQYGTPVYPDVLCAKAAINISLLTVRRNAILSIDAKGTQGTGNYGNYPLYIGRRGGTSLPFNGHIYGLIGIGKLTTDSETAAIEKELAKRVGATLNV